MTRHGCTEKRPFGPYHRPVASSGLEDLDRAVKARRRAARSSAPLAESGTAADRAETRDGSKRAATRSARREPAAPAAPVPDNGRVTLLGAPAGFAPALAAGVVGALLWLAAPDHGSAGAGQIFVAYLLMLFALPTTLLTGLPFFGGAWRVLLALVTSGLLWGALGWWAARRVRYAGDSNWRAYAAELGPMVIGVWAGVVAGLVAMVLLVSH